MNGVLSSQLSNLGGRHYMRKVCLLNINRLKAHEQISLARGRVVQDLLIRAGKFTQPIIVDKNTGVILDGHHRVFILKRLGCRKVPALAVNYQSKIISVRGRRKNYRINKTIVLKTALNNQLLPYKTTKHLLKIKMPKISMNFNQLKK